MKLGTTEISALYLGSNEIKKAYLGTNKVYEKISEIYFNTLISPTTWTKVDDENFTSTDTLGIWAIQSGGHRGSNTVDRAFNNGMYNNWQGNVNLSTYTYIELTSPVYIKPMSIFVRYANCGAAAKPGYVQAYNEDTSSWDTFVTLTSNSVAIEDTYTLSGDIYYRKFRIYTPGRTTGATYPSIFEFQITEGYYKP